MLPLSSFSTKTVPHLTVLRSSPQVGGIAIFSFSTGSAGAAGAAAAAGGAAGVGAFGSGGMLLGLYLLFDSFQSQWQVRGLSVLPPAPGGANTKALPRGAAMQHSAPRRNPEC